tara:strand:+ start:6560 stop:11848 length:5289 start_codon:yes stop_codon:yes gene_type:complete
MPAKLNFYKEFPGKPFNVPFEEDGIVYLKFKLRKKIKDQDTIYNKAIDHYVTHYFPEFYRNMKDTQFDGDNTYYDELRQTLRSAIRTENPGFATAPPSAYHIIITRLEMESSVAQLRNGMARRQELPEFQSSLEFFNEKNNISTEITSQTEIQLESVLTEMDLFGAVMKDFGKQKDNYSGAVPLGGINFNFLGSDISKVITVILREVLKDVEATMGEAYRAQEGDVLTIYFSERTGPPEGELAAATPPPDPLNLFNVPKIAIAGITYSAAAAAGTEFLKVGYLSLIKYKKRFRDPLTLKTLQKYNDVLAQAGESAAAGQPFPMFEFLSETLPDQIQTDQNNGDLFSFPTPNDQNNNDNNELLQEAIRLGLIDVTDTTELEDGIKAYTTNELAQLRVAVQSNPELSEKVYQAERKKNLETGINIANNIERAFEIGPLAMFEHCSELDKILEKIGLKALAKEALICLTFGINFEISRISAAVGNVMEEELLSRPSIDPQTFDIFKIKGDLWKTILDIILNSLQQALLALVKNLTEMLKEACNLNNPRASDYGNTDLAGLIADNFLDPLAGVNPFGYGNDGNSPLGDLINLLGMPQEDIYKYISDLSSILSSLDICILLMDIQSASDELIDRIIEFNLGYGDSNVSTKLVDVSSVIEFFTLLGNITDVTDLCNEIINDLSLLNQDNICLDIGQLDAQEMQNIEDLLDIIENGFTDEPTIYNFDCPEAENYISDPTITRLIPETLSTLVELVEMQFIYSVDSIKSVLLEPSVARADGSGAKGETAFGTALKTVPGAEDWPELPKAGIDALNAIMAALKEVSSGSSDLRDALEACLIDVPGLLNPDLRNIGEAIDILMDVLMLPEISDAIENISDKADQLNQGTGPAVMTYRFNQEFYNKFVDYINIDKADWERLSTTPSRTQYQIEDHFKYVTSAETNTNRVMFSFPNIASTPTLAGLRAGTVTATTGERLDCKDQQQINQILDFGGTVPWGAGCAGTTHGPETVIGAAEQRIELRYPLYGSSQDAGASMFKLDDLFTTTTGEKFQADMFLSTSLEPVNYNLDPFVDAVAVDGVSNGAAEQRYFPLAYGLLVDQVFDYYTVNGIFDAATLQSLNFFHDNANCAADDVSDLLDVSGVFKQMQKEYLEEACNNDPESSRERMREVIKFGMFLLLIQVHVAEFVLKNIFVFGAVEMGELFAKPFVVSYMRDQVSLSMKNYFARLIEVGEEEKVNGVKDALVDIFNRMMQRPSTVANGGLLDLNNNVVFSFGTVFLKPAGVTTLGPNTPTATFNDIIDYLTIYRIQSAMGTAETPGPTSNAVKNALPISRQKPMDEIFLNSMPVVDGTNVVGIETSAFRLPAEFLSDKLKQKSGIVIVKAFKPAIQLQLPCRDQTQIDQILDFGGTVPLGHGCVGTTHGPPDAEHGGAGYVPHTPPPGKASGVLYQCYMYVDNANSVYTSTTTKRAFKLFEVELDKVSDLENYSLREVKKRGHLSPAEVRYLLDNETYQDYFTNVFSAETIGILPILQNFYLTTRYFKDIRKAMRSTKNQVLDILNSTMANADSYSATPDLRRPGARQAMAVDGPDAEAMARDFILKMLIKTPIDIIKGLMQLIDPHVVISKLIKHGTADVFNMIQSQLRQVDLPSPGDEGAPPLAPFADGADGGDAFVAVLCLLQYLMENPPNFPQPDFFPPPGADPPPENFFPRISEDGVDFLGTGMGMLMMPPTPLGLIYLLLSLINFDTEQPNVDVQVDFGPNQTNAGDSGDPSEC